jgi:hypothetical protein
MRYIFHEPVQGIVPSRPDALGAGVALALALAGTTFTTLIVAAALR